MKKSIISWLIFTAFFLIHLRIVSSEIVCFSIENSFPLCEKDFTELINYIPEYADYEEDIDTIEIIDSDIKMLEEYALDDGDSKTKTKKLILSLYDGNLIIKKNAFTRLPSLESLEITTSRVELNFNIFQGLVILKFLKLSVDESLVKLNEVLKDVPNLESLEILDNGTIGICDSYNGEIILSQLQYTGGEINKISDNSFKCLTQLKALKITKTNLSVIEFDAFNYLNELELLSMTMNKYLIYIPPCYKIDSINLISIDLSNNSIEAIDKNSFVRTISNNCLLLNLSYNALSHLKNKTFGNCQTIDLSANQITLVFDSVFAYAIADKILMHENLIINDEDHVRWGIGQLDRIHFDIMNHEIAVNQGSKTRCINEKCYSSKNNIFEICKSCKTLLSVTMKSMPTRLSPKTLEITDNKISYIEKQAFSNLVIENLIIESFSQVMTLNSESFEGLSTLKNLIFKTSPILIAELNMNTLKKLEHFVISFALPSQNELCMYVELLTSLRSSIVIEHGSAYFCNNWCEYKNTKLKYLQYQKGLFDKIPKKSFKCLNGLNTLIITDSSLQTFDTGAFEGLGNLDTLILENNKITLINKNTFIGLPKLKKLSLAHNSILFIDSGAFRLQKSNYLPTDCTFHEKNEDFCKPKTLSVLDLSFNKLQHLRNDMLDSILIEQIDLSNNDIISPDEYELEDYKVLDDSDKIQLFLHKEYEKNIQLRCFNENSFIICMKNHDLLFITHNNIYSQRRFHTFGPKNPSDFVSNLVLELYMDHDFSSIQPFAFVDMTSKNQVKTLIINKHSRGEFIFQREIFAGLLALENLELNVGPIKLKDRYFDGLYNLKSLKIEAIDADFYLSETLQYLALLESLEIVSNASVGICDDPFADSIPLVTSLLYTSGTINILQKKSLTCLPHLKNFKITDTLLRTIEADAFYGLSYLKTIDLAYNELKYISIDVFNHIYTLNVLKLNNNHIAKIDVHAFTMQVASPYYFLLLLDLSNNKLRNLHRELEGLKCKLLDLSGNDIDSDNIFFSNSCIRKIIISVDNVMSVLDDCQH